MFYHLRRSCFVLNGGQRTCDWYLSHLSSSVQLSYDSCDFVSSKSQSFAIWDHPASRTHYSWASVIRDLHDVDVTQTSWSIYVHGIPVLYVTNTISTVS